LQLFDLNDLTYEMLNEMKYLECCLDESLRKYPLGPHLFRVATKDYTFKGTNVSIKKGTSVFIPVLGLHRDANIFDDPMVFKPERFLDSPNGNAKCKGSYFPFGDGPRKLKKILNILFFNYLIFLLGICIGARLAKIQMKVGLLSILSKFKVELADMSLKEEMTFDKTHHMLLSPDKPFNLKVRQRVINSFDKY
jgi:cytochrome P450 family 6